MSFNEDRLWRVEKWFPDLDKVAAEKLRQYHTELLKFNSKLNLISTSTERQADLIHFADCIMATRKILSQSDIKGSVLDIGSGNGFPGIVGAILFPKIPIVMVERDVKKSEFLKFMVQLLGLKNGTVMNMQIEEFKDNSVELAMSRAFAPIPKAILQLRKQFKVGGRYYHLKGEAWVNEVSSIPPQLCSLWSPKLFWEYELPENGPRLSVIVTNKIAP